VTSVVVSLLHSLRFARSAASRNPRAPTPAHRRPSKAPPTTSFDFGRPDAVGVALTGLAILAVGTSRRQARDSRRVAPTRLSPVLDLEKPPAHRTTRCANRRSCAHPRTVNRESPLRCAPDSRRVAEVGNLCESVDRREVHATASAPAITNVADLPHQSREPTDGRRPVRRADGHVPAAIRAGHPRTADSHRHRSTLHRLSFA
jgi:hypothetical protein